MRQITAKSMGQAWFSVMRAIMSEGNPCLYTDNAGEEFPVKELLGLNVIVEEPHWPDAIIEDNMVLSEFEWMKDNFTRIGTVPALSNADSYATRLYNYMDTKNQIDWVVRRLTEEPRLRSATITTFEPLKDEKYIPCVSLIDFQIENDTLHMYAYCRALDLGTKAYANFVMLYDILANVAQRLSLKTGALNLIVKSAHIYDRNMERVNEILDANPTIGK